MCILGHLCTYLFCFQAYTSYANYVRYTVLLISIKSISVLFIRYWISLKVSSSTWQCKRSGTLYSDSQHCSYSVLSLNDSLYALTLYCITGKFSYSSTNIIHHFQLCFYTCHQGTPFLDKISINFFVKFCDAWKCCGIHGFFFLFMLFMLSI